MSPGFVDFKYLLLQLIKIYQKTLSRDHGWAKTVFPFGACRFRPTCSEYAALAITKYGIIKGVVKTIGRLLRCHPFNPGGWDAP